KKKKKKEQNRLYHFSDASLLYIEKNGEQRSDPETLFNQIQSWLNEFATDRKINRIVRIGITDYPFLPRAYTAINDKELLDILLMATHIARELSLSESQSHWVYLKAIENAPAASFASENIRLSCKQAINQGLIKVHSSYKNEENIKKLLKDG
ncbi:tetratricopeptide repeat protein, partial [Vibrio metoecus]